MELAFEHTGSGPGLILVHGITERGESWRPLVEPLAQHYEVLSVDLRGHGQSRAEPPYDPLTLAADVHETAVSRGLGDAPYLVGHSLGGVVVTAYAAAFPVSAVVNVDQPLRLAAFQQSLAPLAPMLRGTPEEFLAAIDVVFSMMIGPLEADEVARLGTIRRADQDVVMSIWSSVLDSTPEELDAQVDALAGAVHAPYLSLHGIDPGPEYSVWLLERIRHATFEVWPDHGHYPHLADPTGFVDRVRSFDPR